jgi:hypothetical protein
MQNLPAQSVTAPEKVRCLRNNTPNHTLPPPLLTHANKHPPSEISPQIEEEVGVSSDMAVASHTSDRAEIRRIYELGAGEQIDSDVR